MSNLKRSMSIAACAATGLTGLMLVSAQPATAAGVTLAPGSYTANTSTLTLTGPSVTIHGSNVHGVAVFSFASLTIPSGATITATGSRPLELKAKGSLTLGGEIVSNGTSAVNFDVAQIPTPGGAGGGAGGIDVTQKGRGPGGGGVQSGNPANGAGGGGFGGKGARGGDVGTGTAGPGGKAYGDLTIALQGGSGGGGAGGNGTGSPAAGGGGGGAIGLFGNTVTLLGTADVVVDGGNGAEGGNGASGGGSGGGIIVHGNTVNLGGILLAEGGEGGGGGCCGDGGGGGGGRISVQYKTFLSRTVLITEVNGGTSGAAGASSGTASPDATGENGRFSVAQIDASKLTIGGPASAAQGKNVTLSTKLTDAGTGRPAAHLPVTLYKKAGGGWSKVATKTTSATGVAKASVKLTKSSTFQWRFRGTLIHLKVSSATRTVRAR